MTKLATLNLQAGRFQVAGPSELVSEINLLFMLPDVTPATVKLGLDQIFEQWHVVCAASGEPILLCDLKYWDVETQKVYRRPELVPGNRKE
jgi:hypothetical protein